MFSDTGQEGPRPQFRASRNHLGLSEFPSINTILLQHPESMKAKLHAQFINCSMAPHLSRTQQ